MLPSGAWKAEDGEAVEVVVGILLVAAAAFSIPGDRFTDKATNLDGLQLNGLPITVEVDEALLEELEKRFDPRYFDINGGMKLVPPPVPGQNEYWKY